MGVALDCSKETISQPVNLPKSRRDAGKQVLDDAKNLKSLYGF
jgi:hypothetical protein